MKPYIEKIGQDNNFTWRIEHYSCLGKDHLFGCGWHYHHEFELVLCHDPQQVTRSTAISGDRCYEQTHNTLVLYGPGLPHMVSGHSLPDRHCDVGNHILWFDPRWIETMIKAEPALAILEPMLKQSSSGLRFSQACAEKVADKLRQTRELSPARQFGAIIDILLLLAEDRHAETLASTTYAFRLPDDSSGQLQRLHRLQNYIEHHYQRPIRIAELCDILHMSESSVYRLFERHFNESFADHLKRYRIGKACERIISTELPIALIAEQSGFSNLSNFNRQFRQSKGMTPSTFRRLFRPTLADTSRLCPR